MSSASSNHSFVRNGAGYDEVYPSGHKDHGSPSEERSSSASSPSLRDEGLEKGGLEDDFLQDLDDNETSIQTVVGPDGLRKFIMLPIWTVNDFISSIKEPILKHSGASTKSLTTYLSVCLISRRNVTMTILTPSRFMSKC